jgi:hypothetical protein
MSGISDDHLAQVRAQSEQAFAKMQRDAEQAHAAFLNQYGGEMNFGSSDAPAPTTYPMSPGPQAVPVRSQPAKPSTAAPDAKPSATPKPPAASNPAEKLYESSAKLNLGSLSRDSLDDSVQDAREDLGKLSASLREESRAAAREALKGTSDILKGNASGLGAKAKQEAARLKEAMKQAMEEERNLKAMKGRARQEVKKAKERFKSHVEEAKDDVMGELKGMAQGSLESLRGKATGAFEQGQDVVEREWKDFTSGQDSN